MPTSVPRDTERPSQRGDAKVRPRLAVLSHACFRAVNRRVFALIAERGFDVMIIVPQSLRNEAPDPAAPNDPPVHFLPLTTLSPRTYRFTGAEAALERFGPDIVLIDADPASVLAVTIGGWCRRHRVKLACLTAENLDFRFGPHVRRVGLASIPQATAKALLHARARPLVDQVFTINREGTELYRSAGYSRVMQIPLGYDPAIFHPDPQARAKIAAELGLSPTTVLLGAFGRATPQKGLHHIIEALRRIHAAQPALDWHLLLNEFQSDNDYARRLKAQIESAGLAGRCTTFTANHESIARYMAATDAVVLASLSQPRLVEQFGRVISESMACGALPIVSDSGTPKDLVAGNGLVFPEGDVGALTKLLSGVIENPEATRNLADAARRHAEATLTIAAQADLMITAFRGLSRIRIAAISHACVLPINRRIYRELAGQSFDVELIVPYQVWNSGRWLKAAPREPVDPPIRFLPMQGKHGRLYRYPALSSTLDQIRPDLVMIESDTASLLALSTARWCRRNGARFVSRSAENLSSTPVDVLKRGGVTELPAALLKILLNKRVKRNVAAVCVMSAEAQSVFHGLGYKNTLVVPMGTDVSLFRYCSKSRHETRAKLGLARGDVVIAYFGRLVPQKGVDTLIRAVSLLQDLPWRLLLNKFENATAYTRQIEQLIADAGIGERVIWARSRHGDVSSLMTATDVAVVPSRSTAKWSEQFGRVVTEAMACGNLLLVSNSGTPKELIGPGGQVFPEGDHAALAGLLRSAHEDKAECLVRRRAAIRHAHRHYSIEVEAGLYAKLFRQLMAK